MLSSKPTPRPARMREENCRPLHIVSDCSRTKAIGSTELSGSNRHATRRTLPSRGMPRFQGVQSSDGIFAHHNTLLRDNPVCFPVQNGGEVVEIPAVTVSIALPVSQPVEDARGPYVRFVRAPPSNGIGLIRSFCARWIAAFTTIFALFKNLGWEEKYCLSWQSSSSGSAHAPAYQ